MTTVGIILAVVIIIAAVFAIRKFSKTKSTSSKVTGGGDGNQTKKKQ